MTIDYPWRCMTCGFPNPFGVDSCMRCACPAAISAEAMGRDPPPEGRQHSGGTRAGAAHGNVRNLLASLLIVSLGVVLEGLASAGEPVWYACLALIAAGALPLVLGARPEAGMRLHGGAWRRLLLH